MRGALDDKTGIDLFKPWIGNIIEVVYTSSQKKEPKLSAIGFLKGIEIVDQHTFRIMIDDCGIDLYSNWIVMWRPYTALDWRTPKESSK